MPTVVRMIGKVEKAVKERRLLETALAELDAEVLTGSGWDHLATRGFDAPRLFSAYLHTLRWNCVTATDPRLFQAPFRAGIKLDYYQLEPLRKALLHESDRLIDQRSRPFEP